MTAAMPFRYDFSQLRCDCADDKARAAERHFAPTIYMMTAAMLSLMHFYHDSMKRGEYAAFHRDGVSERRTGRSPAGMTWADDGSRRIFASRREVDDMIGRAARRHSVRLAA